MRKPRKSDSSKHDDVELIQNNEDTKEKTVEIPACLLSKQLMVHAQIDCKHGDYTSKILYRRLEVKLEPRRQS